jgi:hypothetical protein
MRGTRSGLARRRRKLHASNRMYSFPVILEASLSKLYHFSQQLLANNTPLKPGGVRQVGAEVKKILDARKLSTSIPLSDAIYLSESDDGSKHGLPHGLYYVHYVEPVGPVERRDNGWIGELQARHSRFESTQKLRLPELKDLSDDEVADRYWRGDASPRKNWEFVTRQAVVSGLVFERPIYVGDPVAKAAYEVMSKGRGSGRATKSK